MNTNVIEVLSNQMWTVEPVITIGIGRQLPDFGLFFIYLLFGHIVGDYLFQPKRMAIEKGKNTKTALVHCLIYAICVINFTMEFFHNRPWMLLGWFAFIFMTHFLVDRFSWGEHLLSYMDGRSLYEYFNVGNEMYKVDGLTRNQQNNLNVLQGAFTALTYVIVDNGIHLMVSFFGFKWLFS